MDKIKISTIVNIPIDKTWDIYNNPNDIVKWNFADESWHCPSAENDLQIGGKMKSRMEAKDGSFGFDFEAIYDEIIPNKKIKYHLEDGRNVEINFSENNNFSTNINIEFDAETQNPIEMQEAGWQAILDNFKKHAENNI